MKIAVISDTHGRCVKDIFDDADAVIHLGDHFSDEIHTDLPIYRVKGNCDADIAPTEQILELCGRKIFITHGHLYGVKQSLNRLLYRAEELGADAALFGHTHIAFCENVGGILLLNPGSFARPRAGSPSCAKLYVDYSEMRAEICKISLEM